MPSRAAPFPGSERLGRRGRDADRRPHLVCDEGHPFDLTIALDARPRTPNHPVHKTGEEERGETGGDETARQTGADRDAPPTLGQHAGLHHRPFLALYNTRMCSGLVLGIESSCDETAAAVVAQGRHTLSSVVASQIATHAPYGGVVPELASREHLRNIVPVVEAALREAAVSLAEIEAVAVTEGPGLAGALLVGITYGKTLAWAAAKPLIAVNHLEGHIHAVLLAEAERGEPDAGEAPTLALVVSGGHTHLYLAHRHGPGWRYQTVGRTVDDAAGEAFDKVAKLLGLGYPGGPWIDTLAAHGDPQAVLFRFAEVRSRAARQKGHSEAIRGETLFSFSGIKTAVLRHAEQHGLAAAAERRRALLGPHAQPLEALPLCDAATLDLLASFQHAVVGNLVDRTFAAAERTGARRLLVSGGVAANRELRTRFLTQAQARGVTVAFPSLALSTDNAAMIAAAAWPKLQAGELAPWTLSAQPTLRLDMDH
jgi:N6-L-threonylcarbamoyladenine synthase